ncbi:hypothetical protein CHLRE_08g373363v5 [Chlamydomonas reinhardtii]|uniref:Uncharacterized protein n=1 Tax=Chlamydomonas reinhardtii TaxID=3055 RepID=A0A2K3DHF5_CHLRE|nr:uncharacterized protein CHLRE_08g373363v5 [Chlamydomonas reinhardtii]PNW79970.1 hypothetical protein CHLRE_08g373363v5 [Chlamydomonas reinhardtii]
MRVYAACSSATACLPAWDLPILWLQTAGAEPWAHVLLAVGLVALLDSDDFSTERASWWC